MGFLKGLESGWDEFKREFEEACEAVGHSLGRGLPWLIVVVVIIVIVAVLWVASCSGAGGVPRSQIAPMALPRSPELPSAIQPQISTTKVRGVVRRAKYKVSPNWVILRDGQAVSRPLLYAERSIPHAVDLSQPSPSGRYLFVDICDKDWCDDQRLIDFQTGQIISHIDSASADYIILGMKEGGGSASYVTSKSWSPKERYVSGRLVRLRVLYRLRSPQLIQTSRNEPYVDG